MSNGRRGGSVMVDVAEKNVRGAEGVLVTKKLTNMLHAMRTPCYPIHNPTCRTSLHSYHYQYHCQGDAIPTALLREYGSCSALSCCPVSPMAAPEAFHGSLVGPAHKLTLPMVEIHDPE
jgi:hypothetical protein